RPDGATADATASKSRNWPPIEDTRPRPRGQTRQSSTVGAFAEASLMRERRSWLIPPGAATGGMHRGRACAGDGRNSHLRPPTTTAQSVAGALQVNGAETEPERPDSWLLREHYR